MELGSIHTLLLLNFEIEKVRKNKRKGRRVYVDCYIPDKQDKPVNTKITMSSIFNAPAASQEGAFGIGAYEEADDEEVYSTDNMDILFNII